jgi:hypothetical protein
MSDNPFNETAGTLASKILMLRAAGKKTVLVVEGEHDARIYENFIDPKSCLIVIAWGKGNALGALLLVRPKEPDGTIFLVDRDFDFVRNAAVPDPNVIYTDDHDLDLTVFRSAALEKVLRELASDKKTNEFAAKRGDLRAYLLRAAAPIGSLRLQSIEDAVHLTFDGMSFDFVDRADLTYDMGDMVQEVLNRSGRPHGEIAGLVEKIRLVMERAIDHWELCVGEDVLQMLSRALCRMIGSQKPSALDWRKVQTYLRLAYEREYFRASALYGRIKAWEAANRPYLCLAI